MPGPGKRRNRTSEVMVRQRWVFDDSRLDKLSCYFDPPLTLFTHLVAQKLPN